MSLEKEINDGIKAAMLAKEKVRLAGLRAVKAELFPLLSTPKRPMDRTKSATAPC